MLKSPAHVGCMGCGAISGVSAANPMASYEIQGHRSLEAWRPFGVTCLQRQWIQKTVSEAPNGVNDWGGAGGGIKVSVCPNALLRAVIG